MFKYVVLTGAGISAESGLKTFRGNDGLWENHRIEDVATPEAFARDPDLVQRFYRLRREQLLNPEIKPNAAHLALAKFQTDHPDQLLIVTQNVDNLHEQAGSSDVWHMHGELLKGRCQLCHDIQDIGLEMPKHCHKPMRPHIVWFGEVPFELDAIATAVAKAEVFIAIGTSGQVYPAAGFVQLAKSYGKSTIEFNLEATDISGYFDQSYFGAASETIPTWLKEIS